LASTDAIGLVFCPLSAFAVQENLLRRIVVFGNSGSGKSTLASSLAKSGEYAHLDLDSIAWLDKNPPERASISESARQINNFISAHQQWVIEGCYADLVELVLDRATEMIFLNLSVDDCILNAKQRPWEPHKYQTKQKQDENLEMLIGWIRSYPDRNDSCSLQSHLKLYERFDGIKTMRTENQIGS
jgi:adenylate kinase family enzyme